MFFFFVCKFVEIKIKVVFSCYIKFVIREEEVFWFGNVIKIMFSVKNWELVFLLS